MTYAYSPGGLLNNMTDTHGNRTDYLYDPAGRLTEKWLANGVNTRYQYNPDNTLVQVTNRVNGTILSQHDYTYDNVGNRQTHIELINGTTTPYKYIYDELNRLKEVRNNTTNALIEAYANDPLGNRTTKTAGATTYYYSYDVANALKEIRTGSTTGTLVTGLVYDVNGNLTQKCESGTVTRSDTACTGTTVTSLTYDALNRLTQATKTNLAPETYVYDGQGRRIQKTGSSTTNYLYNGPDITAEYGTSWTAPTAQYTHGPNWDDPISRITATATQYYHQDGLGSVVVLTNQAGGTDGTQRFDAFGNKLATTGTIPQYGYTGREPDNTGLIYYRARTYDPSTGTFTQRDPEGMVDGVNLYTYVRNNPVNYTDPTGTQAFNNSLTYLNTYNTNYYGTSTSNISGVGYISSGNQSLASVNSSSSYLSDAGNALQSLVPGNTYANYSYSAFQSGDYGSAAGYGVAAVADVALAVMTAGTGNMATTLGRGVGATLSADIASTFRGGKYASHMLQSDVEAFRFSGGISRPEGRFLTTRQTAMGIATPQEAIQALNLPIGATAEQLNSFIIPKGTRIFYGRTEGGWQRATQIFIEDSSVLKPVR